MNYETSNTTLTATWVKTFKYHTWHNCSNCNESKGSESHRYPSYRLPQYCPNCGAKMTNPQYICIEVDYE